MSELPEEDVFPEESDVEEEEEEENDIGVFDGNEEVEEDVIANADEDEQEQEQEGGDGEGDDVDGGNEGEEEEGGDEKEITYESNSDAESDSDDDEDYLQKFNQRMRDDLILNFHPESKSHNYEEIKQLAKVMRNKNGIIMDELHKTIPILTKYEKTRILGQRAKQIETGAIPLVQVPPNIIDSYLIAKLELAQNKIPFIIRRPLPNGGMEYWYVSDLENL